MLRSFTCDTSEFMGMKLTPTKIPLVDFYLELTKKEEALKEVNDALNQKLTEAKGSPASVAATLLEAAKDHNESAGIEVEDLLARIAKLLRFDRKCQQEVEAVLSAFMMVDTEALESFLTASYGKLDENDGTKGLKAQKGKLEAQIEDLWASCEDKCFDTIPHKYAVAFASTQDALKACVSSFVTTWKKRAQLFQVPVTPTGIDINTLPEPSQETWRKAFKSLGIKHNVRPTFVARKAPEATNTGLMEIKEPAHAE